MGHDDQPDAQSSLPAFLDTWVSLVDTNNVVTRRIWCPGPNFLFKGIAPLPKLPII